MITCKYIMEQVFKIMNAQNLYISVKRAGEVELLVKDSDDEVNAQGDPDLGFHGIGAGAVVVRDAMCPAHPGICLLVT